MSDEPESKITVRSANNVEITLDSKVYFLQNLLNNDRYDDMGDLVEESSLEDTINVNDREALDLADELEELSRKLEKILGSKNKVISANVGGRWVQVTHVGRATLEAINDRMFRGQRSIYRYVSLLNDQREQVVMYERTNREIREKNDELQKENEGLIAEGIEQDEVIAELRQQLESLKRGLGGDELRRGKRVL